MNPLRKDMQMHSTLFPFTLVYRDTKIPDHELPDHFHDWHEIVYVYGGNGIFFIDNTVYTMSAGDLFVIPANTIHRAIPDSAQPVTSTAIFFRPPIILSETLGDPFSYHRVMEETAKNKIYRFPLAPSHQTVVQTKIDILFDEMNRQQFGYRSAVVLELRMMLLQLYREVFQFSDHSANMDSLGPRWLNKALHYIEENFVNPISLHELSNQVNVSSSHFSRVFRQMTGMSFVDYITVKRIILARELLCNTEDNIAVIAELCGFSSLPHFHRTFVKHTNSTPAAYRRHTAPFRSAKSTASPSSSLPPSLYSRAQQPL